MTQKKVTRARNPGWSFAGYIIHLIPYVGFPCALSALKAAQDVFAEQGVAISEKMAEKLRER